MKAPIEPSLQGILDAHLATYRRQYGLSARQQQVCFHIQRCQTGILGVGQQRCDQCNYRSSYRYSCRDRHCPGCQHQASKQWCAQQQNAVLPVPYHHLVFTLPSQLNAWVGRHSRVIYTLLFHCAWHTLKSFGQDPRRLNGKIGMSSVLHTWGENLARHVHLHCLVPGGALTQEGEWNAASQDYLFPVKALSRHFRGSMVSGLRQAYQQGELNGITSEQIDPTLDALMKLEWVIYSKPVPHGAGSVIDYLGRYSHRIAISNQRIRSVTQDIVRFEIKDYRRDGMRTTMELAPSEFIRRYLLHVLPKGLMRIRHYGLLANCCRRRRLAQVRAILSREKKPSRNKAEKSTAGKQKVEKRPIANICPRCEQGRVSHHVLIPRQSSAVP